jgi:outer membrane protein assembly factor BamB
MDHRDLKEAIEKHVLVKAASGARIIAVDEISTAPWLFDFRALLLQSKWLKRYAEVFWNECGSHYPFQVCGMESAAISLVAAIVLEGDVRGKPVNGIFIRKSRKRQGLMKRIEGTPTKDPVILVDDLINSGSTFAAQIQILEREGLRVSDLFALIAFKNISDYTELLKDGVRLHTIFSLKDFGLSYGSSHSGKEQLEELWHFAAPEPSYNHVVQKSAPVLDGERVYLGTDNGTFYALDQKDGTVAWTFETGTHPEGKGIFSSPALHKGTVYFGAYDGIVYALDARTGKPKWTYEDADWIGSSPALSADLDILFIGLEFGLLRKRGGIVALRTNTGERIWEHRTGEYTHGSPLYIKEKNMIVIGSNDETVYAYRADSGTPLWQYRTNGNVMSSFSYDHKRDMIVFGSLGGYSYALSSDGTPAFALELGAGVYSTPLVIDDTVYVASLDKRVYAIDLSTGKKRWHYQTDGRIFASPILIDGSIFIGANDGCLHEIDAKTGKGGGVFRATERIVNRIAYNERTRRFFVPTVANELYCLVRS